jgi:hypothetical protein
MAVMGNRRKKEHDEKTIYTYQSTKPRINLVATSNRREALTHTYK